MTLFGTRELLARGCSTNSDSPVTIQLSHDGAYGDVLGVIGADGRVCQVQAGASTATCVWDLPPGKIGLVPFFGPSEDVVAWEGSCLASNRADSQATTCTPTVYQATTFRLRGATLF